MPVGASKPFSPPDATSLSDRDRGLAGRREFRPDRRHRILVAKRAVRWRRAAATWSPTSVPCSDGNGSADRHSGRRPTSCGRQLMARSVPGHELARCSRRQKARQLSALAGRYGRRVTIRHSTARSAHINGPRCAHPLKPRPPPRPARRARRRPPRPPPWRRRGRRPAPCRDARRRPARRPRPPRRGRGRRR